MEMSEEIYANAEVLAEAKSDSDDNSYENVNEDVEKTETLEKSGGDATKIRRWRVSAMFLLLLCALLLTAVIVLWLKFNTKTTEVNQLQNGYDQLQTGWNNLTVERDQLQTRYDQDQTRRNNLTNEIHQLQTRYQQLTVERNQLQTRCNNLGVERDQVQKKIDELKRLLVTGWRYFNYALYYVSTEDKSWTESRQDCRNRGADLVIINSHGEEEFLIKVVADGRAWIGLTDQQNEGEWKWVDGTKPTTTYWQTGEPNNSGDEDCGELRIQAWNDLPCSHKEKWICEKKI